MLTFPLFLELKVSCIEMYRILINSFIFSKVNHVCTLNPKGKYCILKHAIGPEIGLCNCSFFSDMLLTECTRTDWTVTSTNNNNKILLIFFVCFLNWVFKNNVPCLYFLFPQRLPDNDQFPPMKLHTLSFFCHLKVSKKSKQNIEKVHKKESF